MKRRLPRHARGCRDPALRSVCRAARTLIHPLPAIARHEAHAFEPIPRRRYEAGTTSRDLVVLLFQVTEHGEGKVTGWQ